jgi:REP element-mobilizing transposase RayT
MHELPKRKAIRLDRSVYGTEGIVFHLIIRTHDKRLLFADHALAKFIFDSIMNGPVASEAHLLAVCVMPDHVHLLLQALYTNLIDLVGRWKIYTTNSLHEMEVNGEIWQRSFYDHMMRADEDLQVAADYITNNPIKAGIAAEVGEYPYVWTRCQTNR